MSSPQKEPRIVALPSDWGYKPTPALPDFSDIPAEFHEGLKDGTLLLVIRRSKTPNAWCVASADVPLPLDDRWELSDTLATLPDRPRALQLFSLKNESLQIVDYGAAMQSYIAMYPSPTFADQGRALWSTYAYDAKKAQERQRRRDKAEKATDWFNAQANTATKTVAELSNEALILLAASPYSRLYMYRGLANALLELVQAGYGNVNADGWLERPENLDLQAEAFEEKAARGLEARWQHPPSIEKRLRSERLVNPAHFMSGRRTRLRIPYPITL
jgi:hypothetical protein